MQHPYPVRLRFLVFILAFAGAAHAQFPLSLSVTGDTAYSAQPDVAPLFSTPLPGALMVVADHDGAPWLLGVDDNGAVMQDQAIDTIPLQLTGAAAHSDGLVLVGRNDPQHPFVGMTTGLLGPYAWTDAPALEGIFISADVLANGDVLAIGRRDIMPNVLSPYIRRYSATGSLQWTNTSAMDAICYATAGRELGDGSLLITGISGPAVPGDLKTYCLHISSAGSLIANEQVGIPGYVVGCRVLPLDADHAMILANKDFPFSMLMVKVESATCTEVWTHSFADLHVNDAIYDDSQDNYVVIGQRTTGEGWIGRFDQNGDSLWTHDLPAPEARPRHIQPDGAGGFLITGDLLDVPYLLRVNDDGLVTEVEDIAGSGSSLRVVPNPSTGDARLFYLSSLRSAARWEMLDASGRAIRTGFMPANGEITLERSDLEAGLYLVRISEDGRMRGSARWMVQ